MPPERRAPVPASSDPDEPERIAGKYEWEWRAKARAYEARIESLEDQLERTKDSSLSGFPSSFASARFDARKQERIDRLEKQIEAAEDKLDEFEDEARRAGAPPGWLR